MHQIIDPKSILPFRRGFAEALYKYKCILCGINLESNATDYLIVDNARVISRLTQLVNFSYSGSHMPLRNHKKGATQKIFF